MINIYCVYIDKCTSAGNEKNFGKVRLKFHEDLVRGIVDKQQCANKSDDARQWIMIANVSSRHRVHSVFSVSF
jgi:hypothetical protein